MFRERASCRDEVNSDQFSFPRGTTAKLTLCQNVSPHHQAPHPPTHTHTHPHTRMVLFLSLSMCVCPSLSYTQ